MTPGSGGPEAVTLIQPFKHVFVSYIKSPTTIIASERRPPTCETEAGTTAALAVATATGADVLV